MKPSEEYTIHILEDKEFDKLPFGKPREALGMTNPKTKTAWVRKTGVHEMDMGTIRHEFDELMSGTSLHEEDGIRYKKAGNIFKILFTTIASIINPALGAVVGGASALHSNAQANSAKKKAQEEQAAFAAAPQATRAFAPQAAASPSPLSDIDFNQGLANIDKNRQQQTASVFDRFRGLGTRSQNSAFDTQLTNVDKGIDKTRQQFITDQEERKRSAGLL